MPDSIADVARRLAENAEAVCRHYLSNGRRAGQYWLVGDVHNTPGRSLYVRLSGTAPGDHAAGRWTDAATLEHGDLLDLITAARGLQGIGEALAEARRFLGLPPFRPSLPAAAAVRPAARRTPACRPASRPAGHPATDDAAIWAAAARISALPAIPAGSAGIARRLFLRSQPIAGTIAAAYLEGRGIAVTPDMDALRFHPHCRYRADPDHPEEARRPDWPALIAAVTDLAGMITGVHRTWLDPSGRSKAPVATPRRSLCHLLGNAVRFGAAGEVLAAGEGIETVLSLRAVLPTLPLAAALSATHLAAIRFPATLRRLYILRDNDPAGHRAAAILTARARDTGIDVVTLASVLGDFNDDLRQRGLEALAASVREQLVPADVIRFYQPTVDHVLGLADHRGLARGRGQAPSA